MYGALPGSRPFAIVKKLYNQAIKLVSTCLQVTDKFPLLTETRSYKFACSLTYYNCELGAQLHSFIYNCILS